MSWVHEIEKLGIQPPDSDYLRISIGLPPVSLQSAGNSKREFIQKVREECSRYPFLLAGEVQIEVTWHVHEQERYETDRSPDVDNILKPLLDGLSGPEGILIDDNQVQSICCSWIDWTSRDEEVVVEVKYLREYWVPKGHFKFVQFDKGLCYPIATYFPRELQKAFVSIFEKGLVERRDLEKLGARYEESRALMPIARVFHRTRISQFPVVTLEEFKRGTNEP